MPSEGLKAFSGLQFGHFAKVKQCFRKNPGARRYPGRVTPGQVRRAEVDTPFLVGDAFLNTVKMHENLPRRRDYCVQILARGFIPFYSRSTGHSSRTMGAESRDVRILFIEASQRLR